VKKRLDSLAGGISNDPSRWEKSKNRVGIYRILRHLEWAEGHPQSLGFQRPEELRHLEAPAAASVQDRVSIQDDVVCIEEHLPSQRDVVNLDEFVSVEDHWNQVFIHVTHSLVWRSTPNSQTLIPKP